MGKKGGDYMITTVRPNGDITVVKNGEFISAYYFIPKEIPWIKQLR